jgi:tight adherence protein B
VSGGLRARHRGRSALRGRRDGSDRAAGFDRTADALDEAVVLLGAGLGIEALAGVASHETRELFEGVIDGGAAQDADADAGAKALVQAVLRVCRESGAPLAAALLRQAEVHRVLAQGSRDVDVAVAGPRATARIVSLLPFAGVVMASLLGFDVLGALTGSVLGGVLTVLGALLSVAGALWSRRIVASARPVLREPGLVHELAGVALGGGLPLVAAVQLARAVADPVGRLLAPAPPRTGRKRVHEVHPSPLDEALRDIEAVVATAHRSGASLRPLLLARADLRRRRQATSERARIERLPSALLAPLGLCSLPAFLLLGVAPALVAVVSSTVR